MLKAIIFDIDGVLIDSHQANVDTFAQIIGKMGYSVPRDRIENALMGHTTHETFAMLLPQTTMEQRDAMVQMISDRLPQSLAEFKPTAILGCVEQLAQKYLIGSVTNRRKSAYDVLLHFGVARHFKSIKTADIYPPKPDPSMLFSALFEMELAANEAVFIGDNEVDMKAGNAAKVRTVLVDTHMAGTEFLELVAKLEEEFSKPEAEETPENAES